MKIITRSLTVASGRPLLARSISTAKDRYNFAIENVEEILKGYIGGESKSTDLSNTFHVEDPARGVSMAMAVEATEEDLEEDLEMD